MTADGRGGSQSGQVGESWRRPLTEQQGLRGYLETLRERWKLIGLCVVLTLAAAVVYLATADKVYEAEADLLVTPVRCGEGVVTGLPLICESSDPTRDVETAARLVTTRDVAGRVKRMLGLDDKTSAMLRRVSAEPVAQSNIVAITAEGDSPGEARDLANAFGRQVIADRTEALHQALDRSISRLQQRLEGGEEGFDATGQTLGTQLAQLESLRAQDDPTIRFETAAEAPESESSPKPFLTIAAALVAGLVLGVGGAFGLTALDPRLRREEQLRALYRLPILTRVPKEKHAATTVSERRFGHRRRRKALAPGELSPATLESYRTLRAMLDASRISRGKGRSVLVTGPSPSEGKTTTAINLASSLALAGHRVILIEADFRRPTVGEALDAKPTHGIGKVLLGTVPLEDALVQAKPFGDNLRLLIVHRADDWLAELLSLPTAEALLEEAERLADYVVIDSPPLTEVIDALPLAQQVDDLLIVVRLGSSNLSQLGRLSDLLAQNGIQPTGFVLVGVGSSDQVGYYLGEKRKLYDRVDEEEPAATEAFR
jgi:capsular exopolysaccharide synthesis family protein